MTDIIIKKDAITIAKYYGLFSWFPTINSSKNYYNFEDDGTIVIVMKTALEKYTYIYSLHTFNVELIDKFDGK